MWPDQNNTDFITEINKKFEDYKIELNEPARLIKGKDGYLDLYSYQKLIADYMSPNSPYRGVLVYHGLGSGKTITAINVAEHSGRKVVVLLPASLRANFIEEIIKFSSHYKRPDNYDSQTEKQQHKIDKELTKEINKKYTFISSNSGASADKLMEESNPFTDMSLESDELPDNNKEFKKFSKGSLDNKLLIIDEVHNLLSNMISADAKNGAKIYDMIMNAHNLKIIALSGSPVISDPFELALLFNMLRGNIQFPGAKEKFTAFPGYQDFHKYFVDYAKNSIINKNIFQERIVGLVSFYSGMTGENSAIPFKHKPIIKEIPMSNYQWAIYLKFRNQEQDEERKIKFNKNKFVKFENKRPKRSSNTTFRVKTRQASNFAFPVRIEKPEFKKKEKPSVFEQTVKRILRELTDEELTEGLHTYSPKMHQMVEDIKHSEGNIFVYSQFISLEGIGVFARILEAHSFINFNDLDDPSKTKDYHTFAIFSGNTHENMRKRILDTFNKKNNKDGKHIRILLATAAASEGINLKNVQTVIITEPYWHAMRLQQIVGRAARINSHADLPPEKREVHTIIYLSVAPKDIDMKKTLDESMTTDQHLLNQSLHKQELLQQFLGAMREMAIDCGTNYAHNQSQVKECKICLPNNKPMYPNKISHHLLPGVSNCQSSKTIISGLTNVKIKSKTYKKDSKGNIYAPVEGNDNVFIIDPKLTKQFKDK